MRGDDPCIGVWRSSPPVAQPKWRQSIVSVRCTASNLGAAHFEAIAVCKASGSHRSAGNGSKGRGPYPTAIGLKTEAIKLLCVEIRGRRASAQCARIHGNCAHPEGQSIGADGGDRGLLAARSPRDPIDDSARSAAFSFTNSREPRQESWTSPVRQGATKTEADDPRV